MLVVTMFQWWMWHIKCEGVDYPTLLIFHDMNRTDRSLYIICSCAWKLSSKSTKSRLDKFWSNQEIIHDYRAKIQGTGSQSVIYKKLFRSSVYAKRYRIAKCAAKLGFCYTKWDLRHKFVWINIFFILFNQNKRKIKRIVADVCW